MPGDPFEKKPQVAGLMAKPSEQRPMEAIAVALGVLVFGCFRFFSDEYFTSFVNRRPASKRAQAPILIVICTNQILINQHPALAWSTPEPNWFTILCSSKSWMVSIPVIAKKELSAIAMCPKKMKVGLQEFKKCTHPDWAIFWILGEKHVHF